MPGDIYSNSNLVNNVFDRKISSSFFNSDKVAKSRPDTGCNQNTQIGIINHQIIDKTREMVLYIRMYY